MSAFEPMTKEDQKYFKNYFGTNKKPHKSYWTLYYGPLTWPESTNAPYGVCQNKKKQLLKEAGYSNTAKFQIKPAN